MGSDLFNHFAQHFKQPFSKMKMEALMILAEHANSWIAAEYWSLAALFAAVT
jgi:hypothetical protein